MSCYSLKSWARSTPSPRLEESRISLRRSSFRRAACSGAEARSRVSSGSELLLFSVNAITTGTQSQGEVTMRLSKAGRIVNGVGADPDIVVASAKAYLNALNKLESRAEKLNPQLV